MKLIFTAPLIAISLFAGCASSPTAPMGMKAGEFVALTCEGGKSFKARLASDASSVRVRYEGGYELDSKGAGIYEADGWKLVTQGPGATELLHNGKSILKNCKPS